MNKPPMAIRTVIMARRSSAVFLSVGLLLGVGCQKTPPSTRPEATQKRPGSPVTESVLDANQRALQSASAHLDSLALEIQELATSAPWRQRGYFDAGQQDQVESLLFRFLACRHTLCQLANYHRENDSTISRD